MERKNNTWKIVCVLIAALVLLPLIPAVSCAVHICVDPEGSMGRYSPYTREQVLEILKIEYDMEFTVLSVGDNGNIVEYTLCPVSIPELTFSFFDESDGFAGWYARDEFAGAVLCYCAQKCGFEVCGEEYPVLIYADTDAESLALRLEQTFREYFEIFDYCKGDIRKYSSYRPSCENGAIRFGIAQTEPAYYPSVPECVLYADNHGDFITASMVFRKDMDCNQVRTVIAPLF